MFVRLLGSLISVSREPAKAPLLIDVTLLGMISVVIEVSAKAFSPIDDMVEGIEYSPVFPKGNHMIFEASAFRSTP